MAAPRIVPEGTPPHPDREFWVVQDTEPKDEMLFLFEVDPGTPPEEVRDTYLKHMVELGHKDPDYPARYADPDDDYYLAVFGPYGASSPEGNPEALKRRLTS